MSSRPFPGEGGTSGPQPAWEHGPGWRTLEGQRFPQKPRARGARGPATCRGAHLRALNVKINGCERRFPPSTM